MNPFARINHAPLLIALSLLSQFPVARHLQQEAFTPDNTRQSLLWYPATATLIGIVLLLIYALGSLFLAPPLLAVALLAAWVLSTGAIHLDGVADSTDAAAAGHADRTKILGIFKTPDIGAMAVVALILLLLGKAVALYQLLQGPSVSAGLLITIIWSRSLAALYMLFTPYARSKGLGIDFSESELAQPFMVQLILIAAACLILGPAFKFIIAITLAALFIVLWRRFWLKRINGYVGDCVGAAIEWAELICLLVYAL